MKTPEVQLTYANDKKTKLFYSPYTDPKVVRLIEEYLHTGRRIRVFYGDTDYPEFEQIHDRKPDPGHDWGEENEVTGTIGCSQGPIKIPILLYNSRSNYGGGILTDCVIRILIGTRMGFQERYRHPNYHSDYDTARVEPSELASDGYTHAVVPYTGEYAGQEVARFRSERSAKNYLAFMRGERMSK